MHPAVYPVALARLLIEAYTDPGEIVYEPFSGSASTIIAAEQAQRRCFAVEFQPKYCDEALQRVVNETKIVPYRASDGALFGDADWIRFRRLTPANDGGNLRIAA